MVDGLPFGARFYILVIASRMKIKPTPANLRQVHLIHAELFEELREAGFIVQPLQLGENVTTRGIDLLSLPSGARLNLGNESVVESLACAIPALR